MTSVVVVPVVLAVPSMFVSPADLKFMVITDISIGRLILACIKHKKGYATCEYKVCAI